MCTAPALSPGWGGRHLTQQLRGAHPGDTKPGPLLEGSSRSGPQDSLGRFDTYPLGRCCLRDLVRGHLCGWSVDDWRGSLLWGDRGLRVDPVAPGCPSGRCRGPDTRPQMWALQEEVRGGWSGGCQLLVVRPPHRRYRRGLGPGVGLRPSPTRGKRTILILEKLTRPSSV